MEEKSKEMMEEEEDEEIERESAAAGIEPPISEVEVEGANQCATLSQTKLEEHNVTQCLRRAVAMKFQLISHFSGH